MKRVRYTAHGRVNGVKPYFAPLVTVAPTYKGLLQSMELLSRETHYAIRLMNSNTGWDFTNSEKEPWVSGLVMPEIVWKIDKEVVDEP